MNQKYLKNIKILLIFNQVKLKITILNAKSYIHIHIRISAFINYIYYRTDANQSTNSLNKSQ